MNTLPEFPVDDQTLELLDQALDPWAHGDPGAACSSLESFLEMISRMGGSDVDAVESEDSGIRVMRNARYSSHDLIAALVMEVRRLRAVTS